MSLQIDDLRSLLGEEKSTKPSKTPPITNEQYHKLVLELAEYRAYHGTNIRRKNNQQRLMRAALSILGNIIGTILALSVVAFLIYIATTYSPQPHYRNNPGSGSRAIEQMTFTETETKLILERNDLYD